MTPRARAPDRAGAERLERDLLARLGLTADATAQDVEAAHEELVRFLEGAPHELRRWALVEIAAADEAYALLADPTRTAAATIAAAASPVPAARRPAPAAVPRPAAAEEDDDDELIDELDEEVPVRRRPRGARRATAGAGPSARGLWAAARGNLLLRRAGLTVGVLAGVLAIAFVGYSFGGGSRVPGISGTPAPEASGVDQAKLSALMARIAADPKDVDALAQLGNIYWGLGDYRTAADWFAKVVAIQPTDTQALLALGAATFNLGDMAGAEKYWRQVTVLDPKNAEAYYDLGFMYLSKDPPDLGKARIEWNQVIAIAPDSDLAKQVSLHLQSLSSPAPGGATPSPAPSATPASTLASPTPVPSPSATETPR